MDVFVLPPTYEGLPLSVVEAQCAGLPVIASDKVSMEIALTDNVTFLPLEAEIERWADSIRRFQNTIRTDCSQIIREKGYDINRMAGILRKMYLERE